MIFLAQSQTSQWIVDARYVMFESMRLGALIYPTYWALKIAKRILGLI